MRRAAWPLGAVLTLLGVPRAQRALAVGAMAGARGPRSPASERRSQALALAVVVGRSLSWYARAVDGG